jgi:potassium efflux system protein
MNRVPLWHTTVEIAQPATTADGAPAVVTMKQAQPVTLADFAVAVVIVALTVIAARNIPGLLEIAIPKQLPLDAGARYAIITLSRYVLTVVGIFFACGTLGLSWTKVQWLIAAVSVGLGFGLQEIFANFVSGLILLFERPIRVGDIVTIDDVTGVVSRIRTRATTITKWDRKEFVVPNKEFITGRLLNWTLSDAINRVEITVGVAYGSDTNRVAELLGEIAGGHPIVLEDPAPMVTFQAFGASSLDFVVRCYLPNLDDRLKTIHELHTAIHERFAAEGIEIAFPQQDVHIRTIVPGMGGVPLPSPGSDETTDERRIA